MRLGAVLLLAVGMGGAGLVAGYFLYREKVYVTQVAVEYRDVSASSTVSDPHGLERADSRVPVLTERPLEPAPPVQPAEEAKPVTPIDPSDPRTLPESTLAEMGMKREAIQAFLLERTTPILMQRLDDGLAEKVADGDTYTFPDYEQMRTKIYAVRREPNQPWYRAVLPREQYPELYVYKDEVYRLENAIQQREREEARRRVENPR